jgi:hypothetical protein
MVPEVVKQIVKPTYHENKSSEESSIEKDDRQDRKLRRGLLFKADLIILPMLSLAYLAAGMVSSF